MRKDAKVIFTNVDVEAEAVGYLQLFVAGETTENHEIYFSRKEAFPFVLRLKDGSKNLADFLNDKDKQIMLNSFKDKYWENGSKIIKVILNQWKPKIYV